MNYRPPEWQKNKVIWLAWPADEHLWQENLALAQKEFIALVDALSQEQLVVLFPSEKELLLAKPRFIHKSTLSFKVMPYGDIWIRDTFPIFVSDEEKKQAVIPNFNGWGLKYLFDDDKDLSERAARALDLPIIKSSMVFEGGAIECDGVGTMLTTEQCLLNPNRNPNLSKSQIEEEFKRLFGVEKIIWLKEGLKNDHTDGHIDTLARFVGPAEVAIMVPESKGDPNYDILMAIKKQLERESDAAGNKLHLLELPSCGAVTDNAGRLLPASFLNFILGDHSLPVPIYGTPNDEKAVAVLQKYSPLKVVGLQAKAILSGGGAFHCISQEFYG